MAGTSTEYKLAEARYFLDELRPAAPTFDFILSAFLSAARAVPWVMRHEFGRVEGWEKWFQDSQLSSEERALLKRMNDLRVRATKQDGVQTEYLLVPGLVVSRAQHLDALKFIDDIPPGTKVKVTIAARPDDGPSAEPVERPDGTWVFTARVRQDLLDEDFDPARREYLSWGRDYYSLLEERARECVEQFAEALGPQDETRKGI